MELNKKPLTQVLVYPVILSVIMFMVAYLVLTSIAAYLVVNIYHGLNFSQRFLVVSKTYVWENLTIALFCLILFLLISRGCSARPAELIQRFFSRTEKKYVAFSILIAAILSVFVKMTVNYVIYGGIYLKFKPINNYELPVSLISFCLLVPFIEEIYFRGIMTKWLENKTNKYNITVTTSVIFCVCHAYVAVIDGKIGYIYLSGILFLGITSSFLFFKKNSLWPCVVLHGTYNLIMITMS